MIELESLEMNHFGSPQGDPESVCSLESLLAATTVLIASTHATRESDYDEILD
jgi:hypothetical protein